MQMGCKLMKGNEVCLGKSIGELANKKSKLEIDI